MGFQPPQLLREQDFVTRVLLLSTDFGFHFRTVCVTVRSIACIAFWLFYPGGEVISLHLFN